MIAAALLWIALALSVSALVIIASPIRFKADFSYRRPDNAKYGLIFSFLHPWVFSYSQTSEDDAPRVTVFGVRKKSKDVPDDDEVVEVDDIVEDVEDNGGIRDDVGSDAIDVDDSGIGDSSVDDSGVDESSIDDSGINDSGIEDSDTDKSDIDGNYNNIDNSGGESPKETSMRSRLKSYISEIKESKLYRIYDDKPLRAKLLKWARRLPGRVFRSIPADKLKLHATVGYRKDPALLGQVCGYFTAAKCALLRDNPAIDMSMRPIFTKNHFEIDTELSIKTSVSIILWQLSIILLTFPCRRVYKIMRAEDC